jgi:hypothetical protein
MADHDSPEAMAEALCELGQLTANIIPVALRVARRHARKVLGPDAVQGHVEHAAFRMVALALVTNGFLVTERSEPDEDVAESIASNVELAKSLLKVATLRERAEREDADRKPQSPAKPGWLDDATLKRMFEEGAN